VSRFTSAIRNEDYREDIRRGITLVVSAVVLAASGVAAASSITPRTSPGGVTITVTVPADVTSTITTPKVTTSTALSQAAALQLQAALDDPSKISSIADARTRERLQTELRDLDALLAQRPKLRSYRLHLWYVAHHAHPSLTPRRLAALLWCTVWFPRDCG
jgi:hypothetical protein